MKDQGIGAAVRRKEDRRFLTGRGSYVDDIHKPGELWAQIVRSPLAHARIRGIATDAARAAPGVVAVFTGADMQADGVGSLPCGWLIHSADGKPMAEPPHLLADRGLRNIEPRRRFGEASLLGDRERITNLAKLHARLPAVETAQDAGNRTEMKDTVRCQAWCDLRNARCAECSPVMRGLDRASI